MRRIASVLAAMVIMAAVFALTAMPAFAEEADVEVGGTADVPALDPLSVGVDVGTGLDISGLTVSL